MELFSYILSIHTCGNLSSILIRELAGQLGVTEDTVINWKKKGE